MLLAIDVGNTNTVLGVFDGEHLVASWRLTTNRGQTVDEYGLLVSGLFAAHHIPLSEVTGVIVASVVPPIDSTIRHMIAHYFSVEPLFVGPGVKTGMPVHYEPPSDVGADRIVNAVAGYTRHRKAMIIVDFGTATTFDVVSERGEYLGGLIAPGISVAADALFARTARLPRVEIREPDRLIGNTTVGSIQSGLYYGYLGLVDGIIERVISQLGDDVHVMATGGLAPLMAKGSRFIRESDELLTLEGLRLLWDRNRAEATSPARRQSNHRTEASRRT
jgi:type III pantothenate kinase